MGFIISFLHQKYFGMDPDLNQDEVIELMIDTKG